MHNDMGINLEPGSYILLLRARACGVTEAVVPRRLLPVRQSPLTMIHGNISREGESRFMFCFDEKTFCHPQNGPPRGSRYEEMHR